MSRSNRRWYKTRNAAKKQETNAGAIASVSFVSPAVQSALAIPKKRYPSGQPVHSIRKPKQETAAEIVRTALAQREKIVGKSERDDQEPGTVLGILKRKGLITEGQMQAGLQFAVIVYSGRRADGIPDPTPRAADINGAGGLSTRGDDFDLSAIHAKRRYESALKCLLRFGPGVYSEVDLVCTEDRPPTNMIHLRVGLNALCEHLGFSCGELDKAC